MIIEVHQVSGENSDTADGGIDDSLNADPSSWYPTGVFVKESDSLAIKYISGEWWIGKKEDGEQVAQVPTDAGGYTGRLEEQVMAQMLADYPQSCKELRSAPIGSLIGRIGEAGGTFFVGNSFEAIVQETGILFLRINYNSRVNYTFHYANECPISNGGQISVRITVIPPP